MVAVRGSDNLSKEKKKKKEKRIESRSHRVNSRFAHHDDKLLRLSVRCEMQKNSDEKGKGTRAIAAFRRCGTRIRTLPMQMGNKKKERVRERGRDSERARWTWMLLLGLVIVYKSSRLLGIYGFFIRARERHSRVRPMAAPSLYSIASLWGTSGPPFFSSARKLTSSRGGEVSLSGGLLLRKARVRYRECPCIVTSRKNGESGQRKRETCSRHSQTSALRCFTFDT